MQKRIDVITNFIPKIIIPSSDFFVVAVFYFFLFLKKRSKTNYCIGQRNVFQNDKHFDCFIDNKANVKQIELKIRCHVLKFDNHIKYLNIQGNEKKAAR